MLETEGIPPQERPTEPTQGQQVQYSQSRAECLEAGTKDAKVIEEIDWDGPDDPENPRNWHLLKRSYNTLVPALFSFAA